MKRKPGKAELVGVVLGSVLLWLAFILLGEPSWATALEREPVVMVETVPPTRPTIPQTIPPTRTATPTLTATPTMTPTPTCTFTPTPRPAYLPLLFRQRRVLRNGGFESGDFAPGWWTGGTLDSQVVSDQQRSGRYAALLGNPHYNTNGGCPVGEAAIYQIVDVPSVAHPTLHVWYRILSYDTAQFDYFAIEVGEWPSGPMERLFLDGCNYWNGHLWPSGWREAVVALDYYRGKTILIKIYNAMTNDDGWYNTWTYVDDVSIQEAPGY